MRLVVAVMAEVAAASTVAEASTAVVVVFTGEAFTVVDFIVEAFTAADFTVAVFMPFALLRGRDAITAQAASNPTPPAPAMRAFRKAESRKAGFRKVESRKA
jgi:hypothetical protein